MKGQFLYVFSRSDRERMLNAGFPLLMEDSDNSVYVFRDVDSLSFALEDISYLRSNSIRFPKSD